MDTSELLKQSNDWCRLLGVECRVVDSSTATVQLLRGSGDARLIIHDDHVSIEAHVRIDPKLFAATGTDSNPAFLQSIQGISASRSGSVDVDATSDGKVTTRGTVYIDGLSRHSFASTLNEVAKVAAQLKGLESGLRESRAALDRAEQKFRQASEEAQKLREEFIRDRETSSTTEPAAVTVELLTCNECGSPVNSNEKFCSKCGRAVALQPIASDGKCIHCGAPLHESAGFCSECGKRTKRTDEQAPLVHNCPNPKCRKPVPDGNRFCPSCGTHL